MENKLALKWVMSSILLGFMLASSAACAQESLPVELLLKGKWVKQLKSPEQYQLYMAGAPDLPDASNGPKIRRMW